jgi:hypothetical protein
MKFLLTITVFVSYSQSPQETERNTSLPNVVSDLLMLDPSLSRSPTAPVLSARSEPAKSTRDTRDTFSPFTPLAKNSVIVEALI